MSMTRPFQAAALLLAHQVTLQTADGQTRTIRVRDDIDLGAVNVGDDVSAVVTLAMTISLERP